MKIIKEAITEDLLEEILQNNKDPLENHPHEIDYSRNYWGKDITEGATSDTLVRHLTYHNPELAEKIFSQVSPYLKPIENVGEQVAVMMYHWLKGTRINVHKDWEYQEAASIYLNKNWKANWGGLYFWTPEENEDALIWSAVSPQARTMVVNDENQWHSVTPVSEFAEGYRMSIQIFVHFPKDEEQARKAKQLPHLATS